ncbi:MAG: hypothetical protein ABEJ65_08520 [bacterium]
MANIQVRCTEENDGWTCQVTVLEGQDSSHHTVQVPEEDYNDLVEDTEPEDLVEASFEFLLDREPKESILRQFDIMTIEQYFPNYQDKIQDYL